MKKEINIKNLLLESLDCVGDGVIITDILSNIIYVNDAGVKIIGNKENILHKTFTAGFPIFNVDNKNNLLNPVKTAMEKKKTTGLVRGTVFINEKGENIYLSATCSPIIENNEVIGGIVVFRNINKIKDLEQRIYDESNNFSIDIKIYSPILYSCKIYICRRQADPRRQGIPIEQIFWLFLIEF